MSADAPSAHTIEALTLVLGEDEVRSWVQRWRSAGGRTRKAMETEAALNAWAATRRNPERLAERQRLKALFEREGLEGGPHD